MSRVIGIVATLVALASPLRAQSPAQLLVTVVDADGAPVSGLTAGDLTLQRDGAPVEILDMAPLPATVQVVAIFEGLAVTQRQLNAALARFIGSLDDESIVDMQSVEGDMDDAIVEAIDDLHARETAQPVIVLLGQDSEIARSELQSSQVRGRRRAADLSGDLDRLSTLLAEHGIPFYGVSVTSVPMENLERLAARSGGRFETVADAGAFDDTLAAIGASLGVRYLVTYAAGDDASTPQVSAARSGLTLIATPYAPAH